MVAGASTNAVSNAPDFGVAQGSSDGGVLCAAMGHNFLADSPEPSPVAGGEVYPPQVASNEPSGIVKGFA
jgi:hypothetical protein